MRSMQTTLYSVAAPVMCFVLPLMSVDISEVGAYVKGMEFRSFLSEIIIQIITGIADAFVVGFTSMFFQ